MLSRIRTVRPTRRQPTNRSAAMPTEPPTSAATTTVARSRPSRSPAPEPLEPREAPARPAPPGDLQHHRRPPDLRPPRPGPPVLAKRRPAAYDGDLRMSHLRPRVVEAYCFAWSGPTWTRSPSVLRRRAEAARGHLEGLKLALSTAATAQATLRPPQRLAWKPRRIPSGWPRSRCVGTPPSALRRLLPTSNGCSLRSSSSRTRTTSSTASRRPRPRALPRGDQAAT